MNFCRPRSSGMRDFTDEINLSLRGGGEEGSWGTTPPQPFTLPLSIQETI